MSVYESSIANPKKQLEFYKDLSEQLQQENQRLKEKVGELTQSLNEQMKETNKENLECSKYAIENNHLKEVIEEVRDKLYCWGEVLDAKFQQEVLQILDKAKGEDNE